MNIIYNGNRWVLNDGRVYKLNLGIKTNQKIQC